MRFGQEPFVVSQGLIPVGGLVFIGGPPKTYKTFTLFTTAVQLAIGHNLFSTVVRKARITSPRFIVNRPYKVLLIEQEMTNADIQERLEPINAILTPEERRLCNTNLIIQARDTQLRLDDWTTANGAMYELLTAHRPEILMLDPLVEFHSQDENSAQHMGRIMRELSIMRERFALKALEVAHHSSKPGRDEFAGRVGPDGLRGSSVMFGKGDSYIMLSHAKTPGIVDVSFTIRRSKPLPGMRLQLDELTGLMNFKEWHKGGKRSHAGRPSTDSENDDPDV